LATLTSTTLSPPLNKNLIVRLDRLDLERLIGTSWAKISRAT